MSSASLRSPAPARFPSGIEIRAMHVSARSFPGEGGEGPAEKAIVDAGKSCSPVKGEGRILWALCRLKRTCVPGRKEKAPESDSRRMSGKKTVQGNAAFPHSDAKKPRTGRHGAFCQTGQAVQISSMMDISAASPRRGPIFVMRQ